MMVNYLSFVVLVSRVSRVWAWVLVTILRSNVRPNAVSGLARWRREPEQRRNLCLLLLLMRDHFPSGRTSSTITYNLDLLAVTETWLTLSHGDSDLLDICPTGYSAVHAARPSGKRGGGVSLIYRESYRVPVTWVGFVAASFEHMVLLLQCNSVSIRLPVIYRPPFYEAQRRPVSDRVL